MDIVDDFCESWSGPDELMDFILLGEVLYHMEDPKVIYNKCREWLAPGGRAAHCFMAGKIYFIMLVSFCRCCAI